MLPRESFWIITMENLNPIRAARLAKRWSPKRLSHQSGVSLQTVYDHEKGVIINCNERIMVVFNDYTLDAKLKEWQRWKRSCVKFCSMAECEFVPDLHPLQVFIAVQGYTLASFSNALCIPRKSLLLYLREVQGAMPRVIHEALVDAGLPVADVDWLASLGVTYRDIKTRREVKTWAKPPQLSNGT